ncbi:hypothetical protein LEN26_004955, partial [Aphanomyces euteiches]
MEDEAKKPPKKLAPRLSLPEDMKNHVGDVNAGTYTRLQLRVRAETRLGEELHCSGASYTMGQYNPSESIELVTSPEEYPIWRTVKPLILPRGIVHKYMYAVFSGGAFARWEPIDCDREVIPQGRDMTISEDYGVYDPQSVLQSVPSSKHYIRAAPPSTTTTTTKKESAKLKRTLSQQRFQRTKVKLEPRTSRHAAAEFKPDHPDSTLFLICYHLPIDITKSDDGTWHAAWNKDSLIARSEGSIAESMKVKWVGCITTEYKGMAMSEQDIADITTVLAKMDAFAVFIPPQLSHAHYQGYCKSKLWPMFHNVDILDIFSSVWEEDMSHTNETWWEAYEQVNTRLAKAVAAVA